MMLSSRERRKDSPLKVDNQTVEASVLAGIGSHFDDINEAAYLERLEHLQGATCTRLHEAESTEKVLVTVSGPAVYLQ